MKTIRRDEYLERVIARIDDRRVKVITGLRRCGKSYLLFDIFRPWLRKHGYDAAHIVAIQLDDDDAVEQRTPRALSAWIKARLPKDGGKCVVMIDEIQMCKPPEGAPENDATFYDVLNSLRKKRGVSVYVTGSNSEMLSKDVSTNFRDRGIEIRVWPLSFAELLRHRKGVESAVVWEEYLRYGGMPGAVLEKDREERERYLKGLFSTVYNRDLVERYNLKDDYILDSVVTVLSSSVGSLTNPTKLAHSMQTICKVAASAPTLRKYMCILEDAFLFSKADRWDVKGRRYLDYPAKYYAVDTGLRNAKLNFRQHERTHLMENVIYVELLRRGYSVDVGVVETVVRNDAGRQERRQHEIDFIVNSQSGKAYIQSAYALEGEDKEAQEKYSLRHSGDFFSRLIVTAGHEELWTDNDGIAHVGVIPFLLDPSILSNALNPSKGNRG